MKDKIKHYYNRQFLNLEKHHSIALIHAYVETGEHQDNKPDLDGEIIIGDCGKQITLDFHVSYFDEDIDAEFENALHKLDNLINCLKDFKKAYKKAGKKVLATSKKTKEKEEEEGED